MTRSVWVTVRLPGASTAPLTSTRIWFQTGAVKHGRKTASHDTRVVGTVGWAVAEFDAVVCHRIRKSSHPGRARVTARTDAFGSVAYVDVFWAMT